MKDKSYEFIEHTADIGIKVKGKDLRELFKNSALAMFDIIAEQSPQKRTEYSLPWQAISAGQGEQPALAKRSGPGSTEKIKISLKSDNDIEELLINWLNELLSLSATKELIFSDFKITKLNENNLQAVAIGQDIEDYKVNTEIKAATYHELEVKEGKFGWEAKIIFDV